MCYLSIDYLHIVCYFNEEDICHTDDMEEGEDAEYVYLTQSFYFVCRKILLMVIL